MKQPALGLVATALIIAVSLGFISLFDFPTFAGWVTFCMIAMIPMEIVIGVTWGTNLPGFAGSRAQPLKGILLVLFNMVAGVIVGGVYYAVVGGGISPPIPILMLCGIVSVVVMFWMAIMFGGWPFTSLIKNQFLAGIAMWVACYIVNYLLFRLFFDFSFMQGAPWYRANLDPHGMFNGVNAQVFYVTAIGVLFLMLHFDLWPFTLSGAVMKQPVLGIVWTAVSLVLGWAAYYLGVNVMGMDPMAFLVAAPIPFIFGTILVLNMLHNSLFAKFTQPLRGLLNSIAAAIIGVLLAKMYGALSSTITGVLKPGLPTNDFEVWLASALLGVTFPFLIFYAEFFKMWPLQKSKPE
jgi:tryptophan-rich sensory protein